MLESTQTVRVMVKISILKLLLRGTFQPAKAMNHFIILSHS